MKKNRINYGLKNVHYAKVTETETENGINVEYGTPVRLPGAANISLAKNAERKAIPGDDDPEYAVAYDNKGYNGDLTLYDVPDSFLTDCLGMKVDGETIVENKDDKPSPFALLFEFSGDAHQTRHIMYRCMGENPDVKSETKGDGTNANQATLKITATPAKDNGNIKRKCPQSESEVYTKWFDSVQLSGGEAVATE